MQKISPFLWFPGQAEEAVNLYTSIFENSKITKTVLDDELSAQASGQPAGSVMTIAFELNGQKFTALNGGSHFQFTEAISFVVDCENQEEVDYLWYKLSDGGEESPCGWLKDKYGVSWQIVPTALMEMLDDPDPKKNRRVNEDVFKKKKLDIQVLKDAYEQQ